jgi:hypothetical protein
MWMTAQVVDIADYRGRKRAVAQPATLPPVTEMLTFLPIWCWFGWFLVPVMLPMTNIRPAARV